MKRQYNGKNEKKKNLSMNRHKIKAADRYRERQGEGNKTNLMGTKWIRDVKGNMWRIQMSIQRASIPSELEAFKKLIEMENGKETI